MIFIRINDTNFTLFCFRKIVVFWSCKRKIKKFKKKKIDWKTGKKYIFVYYHLQHSLYNIVIVQTYVEIAELSRSRKSALDLPVGRRRGNSIRRRLFPWKIAQAQSRKIDSLFTKEKRCHFSIIRVALNRLKIQKNGARKNLTKRKKKKE